jgi:dihydrofolate synthase/folylpolyglutamate synthase
VVKNRTSRRWQQLGRFPKIICDTTIDTDWSGIESNSKTKFEQLHIVLGVVNDKDLEILLFQRMLFTTSQSQIIQED